MVKSRNLKRRSRRIRQKNFKNKRQSNDVVWTILHNNIRGFDSKAESLKAILAQVKPSILTLNETMLINNRKLRIDGFNCFESNRNCRSGGGVATCVNEADRKYTIKVDGDDSVLEMVITRHSQFVTPINILNIYGAVESRLSNEEIKDRWACLYAEVRKIEDRGELLVIIGDINAHVGNLIPENVSSKSVRGRLIEEFLATNDYVLVNATDKTQGGPFTRKDPAVPDRKSALDLCLVSKELFPYVDSMKIDDLRQFTPFRPCGKSVTYTDHYAIQISFKGLPLASKKSVKEKDIVRWNTNRKDGWESYKELTDGNEALDDAASANMESDKLMKKIDKELTAVKFKAFGKVKVKKKGAVDKNLLNLQNERNNLLSETVESSEKEEKLLSLEGKKLNKGKGSRISGIFARTRAQLLHCSASEIK